MPGLSAYFPLHEIAHIKPEHTVFISGAGGAVGASAG
jgi:NADPH-dependent curcumin reductase CurA